MELKLKRTAPDIKSRGFVISTGRFLTKSDQFATPYRVSLVTPAFNESEGIEAMVKN